MPKKLDLFTQILSDHWDGFKIKHSGYSTSHYDATVKKTIACGDPKFGYTEFGCMHCGKTKHRVAFTCKTKFCLRCGRVASENFVVKVMSKLHEGVVYRHLILTGPEQLYSFFYKHRHSKELYNLFYKCGWDFIQDVYCFVTKRRIKTGCIAVLHVTGRKGNYRPHLHIIVMNGGIDLIIGEWVNIPYFPYEKVLPRKWQYFLLRMIGDFDKSKETNKIITDLYEKYPKGFVNFFMKGDVPEKSKNLVKYLSKYLFRPMISLKRILQYDAKRGKILYEYADHKTKKIETVVSDIFDFIGRMVQQILPHGFQRVKYYGLQASSSFKKSEKIVRAGLDTSVTVGISFVAETLKYADRIKKWVGKDPLKCLECGHKMELIKIWSKRHGVIFDLLKSYSKKSQAPPVELLLLRRVMATDPKEIIDNAQLELCEGGLPF